VSEVKMRKMESLDRYENGGQIFSSPAILFFFFVKMELFGLWMSENGAICYANSTLILEEMEEDLFKLGGGPVLLRRKRKDWRRKKD
jgi:hypothetical protein